MLIASFMSLLPSVMALNDPANTGGHVQVTGDWIVEDTRVYDSNTVIEMLNGNITVEDGGKLILNNAGIEFDSHGVGEQGITVEDGGELVMRNNAFIENSNPGNTIGCAFLEGSDISIKSSELLNLGGWYQGNIVGLFSGTDNLTMEGSTFENYIWGDLMHLAGDGSALRNDSFNVKSNNGIVVEGEADIHDPLVSPYDMSDAGILVKTGGNATVLNLDGLASGARFEDIISVEGGDLFLKGSYLRNASESGLSVSLNGRATTRNNEFVDNLYGIQVQWNGSLDMLGDDRIYNNYYGITVNTRSDLDAYDTEISNNDDIGLTTSDAEVIFRNGHMVGASPTLVEVGTSANLTVRNSTVLKTGPGDLVSGTDGSRIIVEDSTLTGGIFTFDLRNGCILHASKNDVSKAKFFINASVFSSATTSGNEISLVDRIFSAAISANVESRDDIISGTPNLDYLYRPIGNSRILVEGTDATAPHPSSDLGLVGDNSLLEISDSTFSLADPQVRSTGRSEAILVNNTGVDVQDGSVMDNSIIHFGHHVAVNVQWQNGEPVPGALVAFRDSHGDTVRSLRTDTAGHGQKDVWEHTLSVDGLRDHNIYTLQASKKGMEGNISETIDDNLMGQDAPLITIEDALYPDVNITSPTDGWATTDGNLFMNGTAADVGSGLSSVEVSHDGANWSVADGLDLWQHTFNLTDGDYVLRVRARDVSGLASMDHVNVTVDTTPPLVQVTEPTGQFVTSEHFFLNGTSNEVDVDVEVEGQPATVDLNGNWSLEMNLTDATYNLTIIATDALGNSMMTHLPLIVDTVGPEVTTDLGEGEHLNTNDVVVTGTTDALHLEVNGENATVHGDNDTWEIDLNLPEGENDLTIDAWDEAGNMVSMDLTVMVDTTPPHLNITTPPDGVPVHTSRANLTIEGTTTGADVLTLNDETLTMGPMGGFNTTVVLDEDENRFELVARDLAGNEVERTLLAIRDSVAPDVSITIPEDGLVTGNAVITVEGVVDDPEARMVLGERNLTNENRSFSTTVDLDLGDNVIRVTATDRAGNRGTATITVTYDNMAELSVTSPSESLVKTSEASHLVQGQAEPGSRVFVNDVEILVRPDGSFSYDLVLEEGKNEVVVRTVDAAGNEMVSDPFTVKREAEGDGVVAEDTGMLLPILLLAVGLIVGLMAGMVMGRKRESGPTTYGPKSIDEEDVEGSLSMGETEDMDATDEDGDPAYDEE